MSSALAEETLRLGDERDRLDAELDDLADRAAAADDDGAYEILKQRANNLETRLSGVAYLCEVHSPDATVTIRGLAAGPWAAVEDRIASKRSQGSLDAVPGYRDNVVAAAGLVDAPFVSGEGQPEEWPDEATSWQEAKLKRVSEQPVGVAKWLTARANAKTTVDEGNWSSFRERVVAKSQED